MPAQQKATQILIAKIVNIRFYLMKENIGTTLLKSLLKSTLEIKKFINDISKALSTEKDLKNIIVQIEPVPYTIHDALYL